MSQDAQALPTVSEMIEYLPDDTPICDNSTGFAGCLAPRDAHKERFIEDLHPDDNHLAHLFGVTPGCTLDYLAQPRVMTHSEMRTFRDNNPGKISSHLAMKLAAAGEQALQEALLKMAD